MKPHRKKRLYWIIAIVCGMSFAVSLAIYALGQNVNVYLTPSQLISNKLPINHVFRMGGMVQKNSFKRESGTLKVCFLLTDYAHEVPVQYTGILPTLFKEGQGVVVQGRLNKNGIFIADQVLAKHDEKYMPPGMPVGKSNRQSP